MAVAKKDNNRVNTMIGVLNTDGTTPTNVKITPSNHALCISDGTTGSDLGGDVAVKDNNRVNTLLAVSNSDGSTPVTLYVNSSGELMIQST